MRTRAARNIAISTPVPDGLSCFDFDDGNPAALRFQQETHLVLNDHSRARATWTAFP
jgi:hypothetical protein